MAPHSVSTTALSTTITNTLQQRFHFWLRRTRSRFPTRRPEITRTKLPVADLTTGGTPSGRLMDGRVSRRPRERVAIAASAVVALFIGSAADAHMGTGLAGGFGSGFRHPLTGVDHLLAMVSVGLWGAFLGRPLIFALPVIFPAVMVAGAVIGMLGVPLPPVEMGIAFSVVVLGGCI